MTTSKEDLWPSANDLVAEPADRAPLLLLREQAALLGEKTQNIVEANVSASPDADGSSLDIRLTVVAPALGGYEYVLLQAKQPVDLYPISMDFEDKHWTASDEKGLKQHLTSLFNSARTRKIISSLIAQSKNQ